MTHANAKYNKVNFISSFFYLFNLGGGLKHFLCFVRFVCFYFYIYVVVLWLLFCICLYVCVIYF